MLLEEEEETLPLAPVRWEDGICMVSGQQFTPLIYDRFPEESHVPEGFNAVTISLDGQWQAELRWDEARAQGRHFSQLGFKILWQINLGLFDQLSLPIENQSQLLGLELSLKHFCQTLWKEFESVTLGLVLYKGPVDFAKKLNWSLEQTFACDEWIRPHLDSFDQQKTLFAADVASHYLLALTQRLPDALPLFLLLDASECSSLELQARLFSAERYDRILLGIKGAQVPYRGVAWDEVEGFGVLGRSPGSLKSSTQAVVGVSLPAIACRHPDAYLGFEDLFSHLNARKIPYKIIPEERLALEWAELETLLFSPIGTSEAGKRQLRGFAAAGGTIVPLKGALGFPGELPFSEWQDLGGS